MRSTNKYHRPIPRYIESPSKSYLPEEDSSDHMPEEQGKLSDEPRVTPKGHGLGLLLSGHCRRGQLASGRRGKEEAALARLLKDTSFEHDDVVL